MRLTAELKERDLVNKELQTDLRKKRKALSDILGKAVKRNARCNGGVAGELKKKKANYPLWVKVVLVVEENVAPLVMLLPKGWWVYSEDEGSLCQMVFKWLVPDGDLLDGFESWEDFWTVVSLYINDAMINARNACRLRCVYKYKGERVVTADVFSFEMCTSAHFDDL